MLNHDTDILELRNDRRRPQNGLSEEIASVPQGLAKTTGRTAIVKDEQTVGYPSTTHTN